MTRTVLQRKCSCGGECEECKRKRTALQRKTSSGSSGPSAEPSVAPPIVHDVLRSPGQPLDAATRAPLERRFGHDFSRVRVHRDARAAESARTVNARAYTVGRHVVFGESPNPRLVAHELAHVVQQSGNSSSGSQIGIGSVDDPLERDAERMAGSVATRSATSNRESESSPRILRRTVAASSNCPANVHGAPADPIAALEGVDARAQLMSLGSSHLLFLESITFDDPSFGPSRAYNAYRDWFGTPEQTRSGRWRSRFRRATFATEKEATRHEMNVLSDRFERLSQWLSGNIRYLCPGTSVYTIPGCAPSRCTHDAESCPGSRRFGICPGFWGIPNDDGKASLLIHEAVHARFRFGGHPTSSLRGRGRNPNCYQGFVNQLYQTGVQIARNICTG